MPSEPISVTLLVIDALDTLDVRYFIGGSLASTFHGLVRTTLDTDIVAELKESHAQGLADALAGVFYVDAESIRHAVRKRSSFNVIHLATMFKVDVFVSKGRGFDTAQFERRRPQVVAEDPERAVYVASPEDTVLAKLEWYRLGDEVSERQWRDVLGVLTVQRGRLDLDYMRPWAQELGVADLLDRALIAAE